MTESIKILPIPLGKYSDYRYNVIFKAYKWDPQVEDHSTVSKHAVLLEHETAKKLASWAEQLSEETILMEEELIHKVHLAKELGIPHKIYKSLNKLSGYNREKNVRLMRFDFHPTETGWAVSEVNSDVPGGFPESSIMPEIASEYFGGYISFNNVADRLLESFKTKIKPGGTVALIHATAYSDDRQVMQFLGDYFDRGGFRTVFAAPDHIKWKNKKAYSIIKGREGEIDGIIRFFPLEWLANLPNKSSRDGYYDCETVSCNHSVAIFAQSKRLPLIWDNLDTDIPTWKELLPETINPKSIKSNDGSWIYKPALGRVGEGISIRGVLPEKELRMIEKSAHSHPKDWIAQRMFNSRPLITPDGEEYHLCIGVFTVDGKCAGFYGRISPYRRIDDKAKDIPILVSKEAPYAG